MEGGKRRLHLSGYHCWLLQFIQYLAEKTCFVDACKFNGLLYFFQSDLLKLDCMNSKTGLRTPAWDEQAFCSSFLGFSRWPRTIPAEKTKCLCSCG